MMIFFSFGIYPKEIVTIGLVLGVALIAVRFHLPFRHICLLQNRSNVTAIFQCSATTATILFTLCLLYFHFSIFHIIISQLFVSISFFFFWLVWLPKEYLNNQTQKKDIIIFFKNSLPFALSNIIWIAYFNFDTFMLSLMRTETEVGIYAGVYRIIGINYIIGYAIANSFTPQLYKKFKKNYSEFVRVASQLFKSTFFIGIFFFGFIYLFSYKIIPIILGENYNDGIIVAQILSVAILFRVMNFGLCEILTTSNRQNLRVSLEAITLIVNIAANYIFIPLYGCSGAAIACVIAEIFLFCISSFSIGQNFYKLNNYFR